MRDLFVFEAVARYPGLPGAERSGHALQSHVRRRFRCCAGVWVAPAANALRGADVVALGLMNGARGRVIGVAEVGAAGSQDVAFVISFPTYRGPLLFPAQEGSATWVPIGIEEIACDVDAKVVRAGYPLRLAYSMTGHKSQGIGVERLGIDFAAAHMKPAKIPGWPFVVTTRAFSGEHVCVAALPPLADFVKMRDDKLFQWRSAWENRFDELHDLFLQKQHGVDDALEHEVAMHRAEFEGSQAEWADVEAMLRHRGVAEPPPETYRFISQQESRNDVPRDAVRQADALAGHGRAMMRDGFRMGSAVLDTDRLERAASRRAAKMMPLDVTFVFEEPS